VQSGSRPNSLLDPTGRRGSLSCLQPYGVGVLCSGNRCTTRPVREFTRATPPVLVPPHIWQPILIVMGESSTCGCSCANLLSDLLDRVAKLESAIGAAGGPLGSGKGEPTQPPQSDSQAGKVGETAPGPQTVEVPKDVSLSSTKMLLQQMCLPRDCDGLGRCFGGIVLSWIDLAAAYSAVRVAGGPVVTASVDAVYFLRPLTVNTIAVLEATVNCTFSSSMEVGVRVFEENPSSGERVETCSAFLTFVSLNSLKRAGNPHPQVR